MFNLSCVGKLLTKRTLKIRCRIFYNKFLEESMIQGRRYRFITPFSVKRNHERVEEKVFDKEVRGQEVRERW